MNKDAYINVNIDAVNPEGRRIKRTLRYKSIGSTFFSNNLHNVVELSPVAMAFYFYTCEMMNRKNEILIDGKFKDDFIAFISKLTSKPQFRTVSSLDNYIKQLRALSLIILIGSSHSAFYLVNPKYVFRGSESARKKLLQEIIEYRLANGLTVKPLIDTTEDDFLK